MGLPETTPGSDANKAGGSWYMQVGAISHSNIIISERRHEMEPKIEVNGKTMTITIDLGVQGVRSASGKSIVLCSTRGNQAMDVDGSTVYVGLNVYRKA